MKILLANPPYKISIDAIHEKYFVRAGSRWPFSMQKKKGEKPFYTPYPFYLGYTASLLKKSGHTPCALDGVALDLDEKEFLKRLALKGPDILLMETTTPTFQYDLTLAGKIKEQNRKIIIVMTGTHVTVFPEEALSSGYVDYVISGEYELVFVELVEKISKGALPEGIKGVSYIKNGEIIAGGHSELIYPLDKLLPPDRELFPDDDHPDINYYWDVFCQYKPSVQMHASRGCPFRCYFCLWNQVMYNNGKYRTFSVERIITEIEEVTVKYRPMEIYFDDDDFTARREYVAGICNEIIRRGLKIRWSCMGNIMKLDEEEIRLMAKAGCIGLKFGVESACERIMTEMGKPMDLAKVRRNVGLLNSHGIKTHATFTFGLLNETKESMNETLEFAKSLDTDSVQFSITVPYPGTKLFDILKEQNLIKEIDLRNFDGGCSCIVNYPQLGPREVELFFEKVYDRWLASKFRSPAWLFRQFKRGLKVVVFGGKESRNSFLLTVYRVIKRWLFE